MKKIIFIWGVVFILGFFYLPLNSKATAPIEKKYAADELIIKFKKGQKPKGAKFEGFDIQPIFINHQNDELSNYYKIKLPKTKDLIKSKNDFAKSEDIEKVSLNYLAQMTYTPNDTYYLSQWALPKINAGSAWDITQGSSETVIAVIDSGVDTDHPDIAAKIWNNSGETGDTQPGEVCWTGAPQDKKTNNCDDDQNGYLDDWRGWDFVANTGYGGYVPPRYPPGCIDRNPGDPNLTADNDPNPEPSGLDEDQCLYPGVDNGQHHGTSVAGIAAAVTNNAAGIAGVCPNCSLMALRVLDDEGWGDFTQIAPAIVYAADKGADVINMSLAGDYGDIDIAAALHYAFNKGSLLVAAAGNDYIDIDPVANKLSPVCNDDYDYVDGGENEVIGVAATNSSDIKMDWSNYGKKYVDISAPGTDLYAPQNGGGYTSGFGGTSGATPFVAGVAGLIKSAHPTWDNKAVRDAVIDLTTNINSLNSNYNGKIGGRLNAYRALDPSERLNGSGIAIKSANYPDIFLLQNGQKRHILNPEIFNSYYQSWNYYANVSFLRLDDYPNGPDLLFREGTLLKSNSSPSVYQVEYPSSTKRLITDPSIFFGLGYGWDDIITTTPEVISQLLSGSDINSLGTHVSGALVKTAESDKVYLLSAGAPKVRRLIINPQVFDLNFRWQDIAPVSDLEMATYADGSDYRYQDGSILKGSGPSIYLISYGKKRLFTSAEAYLGRGYNWSQFISVSDEELTHYSPGEDLN